MKRDMELVRKILFEAEDRDPALSLATARPLEIDGYGDEVVKGHLKIMAQANLIEARAFGGLKLGEKSPEWLVFGLTWYGHEFLELTRRQSVWERAVATVRDKAGALPFDVLAAVAKRLVTEAVMNGLQ